MTYEDLKKVKELEEEIQNLEETADSLQCIISQTFHKGSKIKKYFIERVCGKTRCGIFNERGKTDFNWIFEFDREAATVLIEHYRDRIKRKQIELENL